MSPNQSIAQSLFIKTMNRIFRQYFLIFSQCQRIMSALTRDLSDYLALTAYGVYADNRIPCIKFVYRGYGCYFIVFIIHKTCLNVSPAKRSTHINLNDEALDEVKFGAKIFLHRFRFLTSPYGNLLHGNFNAFAPAENPKYAEKIQEAQNLDRLSIHPTMARTIRILRRLSNRRRRVLSAFLCTKQIFSISIEIPCICRIRPPPEDSTLVFFQTFR